MNRVKQNIIENNLINSGEIIGVAVSGGSDSMCLLHYLNKLSHEMDFEVVAITVDHCIRENSEDDASFVLRYCKNNGIRAYRFKVDVPKLAEKRKESIEQVARDSRYGVFDSLLKKDVIDKIAIAHNQKDQTETILLHLFRGTGISGATGMSYMRDGTYIRPMLDTDKKSVLNYAFENDIPYVEDETNKDNTYSRNYIRNVLIPAIEEKWPTVVEKIANFGKDCVDDNEYIESQLMTDAIIYGEKTAKIPNSYFLYSNAIISRIIFTALKKIGVKKDINRVHINMLKELAISGENGKKIKLPLSVTAHKEYDYLTLANKAKEVAQLNHPFKSGSFTVEGFATITVKRVKDFNLEKGELLLDSKKVPKDAVWRFRQNGDMFEKFGGGTKKLKDYFIDRKIPSRLRSVIPVLASGNTILAIAGVEIANSVRVDPDATTATKITIS